MACKQVRPKRELLRVVRTPDGHVLLDPTGKKSGRGAYLCAKRSCWEIGLNKGRLEREFELTLPAEDRAALEAFVETLPVEAPQPAKPPNSERPRRPVTARRSALERLRVGVRVGGGLDSKYGAVGYCGPPGRYIGVLRRHGRRRRYGWRDIDRRAGPAPLRGTDGGQRRVSRQRCPRRRRQSRPG